MSANYNEGKENIYMLRILKFTTKICFIKNHNLHDIYIIARITKNYIVYDL
jgi:hypothetical protein